MKLKMCLFGKFSIATVIFCCVLVPRVAVAQAGSLDASSAIVSDWTHRHLLYPDSRDASETMRVQNDPRWAQNWYLRHPDVWWPAIQATARKRIHRDWSVPLGTTYFQPLFDSTFTFTIGTETGFGTLSTTPQTATTYLATAGSVTVTGSSAIGTYPLLPGGPAAITSPNGAFIYDNVLSPSVNPPLDVDGLLFSGSGNLEVNIWGNSTNNYSFYTGTAAGNYPIQITSNGSFNLNVSTKPDPGGGQTFPAKFVFDVTQAPSCTNDFVAIGLPASPLSGGQANILGLSNLYSSGLCPGAGPTVKFAYASGTGSVPASLVMSQNGKQVGYVENLAASSYFHVLTIGTTGSNGTSATASVLPGTGNNAVDRRVLLSPDGGTTNQGSTNSAFVVYTQNDANDVAYVTTYSTAGTGTGYLYKITNVFKGSTTPTIVWSVAINAVPSTPVYDRVSKKVFFTDSRGRIDYVLDTGLPPAVTYGSIVAGGTTSENPVTIDSVRQMVYAYFNSNGTNAIVVQTPTSMASTVKVSVGTSNTTYTGPYSVDFNNAWYTGSGTPIMYVAGTGTGTLPTLYSVGFLGNGTMNTTTISSAALAKNTADSSPVTEFYNSTLGKDFLFVGVTNNCVATAHGGSAGCIMSLDITNGFPTVNASITALPATGGPSGIIVDNSSSVAQGSSVYYVTKSGQTLVKATQAGLL